MLLDRSPIKENKQRDDPGNRNYFSPQNRKFPLDFEGNKQDYPAVGKSVSMFDMIADNRMIASK